MELQNSSDDVADDGFPVSEVSFPLHRQQALTTEDFVRIPLAWFIDSLSCVIRTHT